MGKSASRKRQRREVNALAGPGVVSFRFNEEGLPPATPDDKTADREASEADRATFAASPGLRSFHRPPIAGEFRYAIPAGHVIAHVEVVQVAPGQRARRPIFRPLNRHEVN